MLGNRINVPMSRIILIVDDDFAIRKVLRMIFQREGYRTEEAGDGAEALQKVQKNRYDLITMDIDMGAMDGVDTLAVLRNETQTPVVVISAHLTEDIRLDLQNRQVHHLLPKPFSRSDVLALVSRALGEV